MKVAGRALALEPLGVAIAIFALDPLDLPARNAELDQGLPPHDDGAFEHLALDQGEVEPVELHQLEPVVDPHHDRGLREGLEHRFQPRPGHVPPVLAEQDRLGGFRARGPEQIDPRAVAIIDLGPELLAELDLATACCR